MQIGLQMDFALVRFIQRLKKLNIVQKLAICALLAEEIFTFSLIETSLPIVFKLFIYFYLKFDQLNTL